VKYQSKFEETIHKVLKRFRSILVSYESERLFYIIPERKARYTPDFILENKTKTKKIYIETKGYLRPTDRTKMVRVKKSNPDADIRCIFQRNNKVKGTKMKYSDWAEKYGFPYAIGPKDSIIAKWAKELREYD